MVCEITANGRKIYFYTNPTEHYHLLAEEKDQLLDAPVGPVSFGKTPTISAGYEVARVDIMVRVLAGRRPNTTGTLTHLRPLPRV